jgi:hypothetical protein
MVLSANHVWFNSTERDWIDPSFPRLPFAVVGVDGEYAYCGPTYADGVAYYLRLVLSSIAEANGRASLIELSLHIPFSSNPVPVNFFEQELPLARVAGIRRVVIFAATFWRSLPDKSQYSQALADFVAP